MSKVEFPWEQPESTLKVSIQETVVEANHKRARYIRLAKTYAPVLVSVLMLFAIVFEPKKTPQEILPQNQRKLEVLISLLPQKKGALLNTGLLREVPLAAKELSKTDKLLILTREDLKNLPNKIIIKKDLPPRKPITWKDLSTKSDEVNPRIEALYRGEK